MRIFLNEIILYLDHFIGRTPSGYQPFITNTNVVRNKDIARRQAIVFGIILFQVGKLGVASAVWRLFPVHPLQPLFHRIINHVMPDG